MLQNAGCHSFSRQKTLTTDYPKFCVGKPVVRADGRCTVTWLPNFLGWVVYHIFLPMVLGEKVNDYFQTKKQNLKCSQGRIYFPSKWKCSFSKNNLHIKLSHSFFPVLKLGCGTDVICFFSHLQENKRNILKRELTKDPFSTKCNHLKLGTILKRRRRREGKWDCYSRLLQASWLGQLSDNKACP